MLTLGLFPRKKLKFEKLKISNSKIRSNESCTITLNVKNIKEKIGKIVAIVKTDDLKNQYLKIDKPVTELPSLDFPNRNTGDHSIMITPHDIPLSKMSFKVIVEIFAGGDEKPSLKKEFSLTIKKKPWKRYGKYSNKHQSRFAKSGFIA